MMLCSHYLFLFFEDSSSLFSTTFLDIDEIACETVSIQAELGVKNGKYVVQNVGSFEAGPRPPVVHRFLKIKGRCFINRWFIFL